MDLVTAAGLVEVAATVVSNFDIAEVGDGDVILIHGGAGGIGSMAVQYAKALGATVAATAGSPDKLAYCRSIGADLAISYRHDWIAAVRDLSGRRGVDVILDVMGATYLGEHVGLLATERPTGGDRSAGRPAGHARSRSSAGRAWAGDRHDPAQSSGRGEVGDLPTGRGGGLAADRQRVDRPGAPVPVPAGQVSAAHTHLESGDNLGKVVLTISKP